MPAQRCGRPLALAFALAAASLALPAKALDCAASGEGLAADFTVNVSPSTAWQPRGGQIKIVVESATQTLKDVMLTACFRWSGMRNRPFQAAPLVQLVEMVGDNPKRAVYAVTVPTDQLARVKSNLFDRFKDSDTFTKDFPDDPLQYEGLRAVPVADLKIVVGRQTAPGMAPAVVAVATRTVGITSLWAAAAITSGAFVGAIGLLYWWARSRQVPGDGVLIRLVSTRDGYVSLSQFQITMWSLLFAAGAIYVMGLSGSLIDIPSGALILLGIASATAIGAKIKEVNSQKQAQDQAPPSAATARPGPVTALALSNVTDRGVTLSWTPPAPAPNADVAVYIVRYARADFADWKTAADGVQENQYRVTGLRADTAYLFEVRPANAAGQGHGVQGTATTIAPIAVTRRPAWSDLVVTPEHPGEIDVTRVQMLFFTIIAAGFVALKLFNSYTIPDIPEGILLLMGISNGTYLSAKFVSN